MHAKKSGKNYRYVCTARHMWGAAKCSNPRGLVKAEVQVLKVEISNLVAGLAKGDLEDIHDAVRDRKVRFEHLEGQLQGIGAAKDFDLAEFTERVGPILKNWHEHLRKNPHTAQQVLRTSSADSAPS